MVSTVQTSTDFSSANEKAVEDYISSTANRIRNEMKDLSFWHINKNFQDLIPLDERKGVEPVGSDLDSNESI